MTKQTQNMADSEERTPLLADESPSAPPPYTAAGDTAGIEVTVPPIGPDELPPPYTPTPQGGIPMINCRVCQAMINIEGKQHLHVVKCSVCQEATPIKAPPPGKRYVRCPCNCLLVCRSTAQRIACPRTNCRRIISVGTPQTLTSVRTPESRRVTCAYCHQVFIFNVGLTVLARCPHCRKVSSVEINYARRRGMIFLILGFLLICAGIGVTWKLYAALRDWHDQQLSWWSCMTDLTDQMRRNYVTDAIADWLGVEKVGTYESAYEHGGIYVAWIGAFVTGFLLVVRGFLYLNIRTSAVVVG